MLSAPWHGSFFCIAPETCEAENDQIDSIDPFDYIGRMASWALSDAKAKFSEVVDRAVNHEPQEITRNGKDAVMVVSKEDWLDSRRGPAKSYPSMADFFRKSPLSGSGIDLRRKRSAARKIEL